MNVELVGPFEERRVLLNGWRVPLIQAREHDGGTVDMVVDNRLCFTFPAGATDDVVGLVAAVIAVAWGYQHHPNSHDDPHFEDLRAAFARVPHPSLAPHRTLEVGRVSLASEAPPA